MATHSSILVWRIPWTEEPGGLQSMGSKRVKHDWAINTLHFSRNCEKKIEPRLTQVRQTQDKKFSRILLPPTKWTRFHLQSVSCSVKSDSLRPHGLYNPPGSSVHGILQTRILEWIAMPSSRDSSRPQDQTWVSCIVGRLANSLRSWEMLLDKKTE